MPEPYEMVQTTIDGPVTGGQHGFPATTTSIDLTAHGYAETEFWFSGTAVSYRRDGVWDSDGRWLLGEGDAAEFTTRLLVRAPNDPARFNGTVLVEWLNVSGNCDADVDFPYLHEEILRSGYAWVGVSAQWVGVHGAPGGGMVGADVAGLTHWDPERYGRLHHPGDAFSYDIFTQAGRAVRDRADQLLPGMTPKHLIAAGQSQSGFRMITYVNAVQPIAAVYNGVIIHARAGSNAPLGDGFFDTDRGGRDGPTPARVRTDLTVPVLQLITETELFETGGGAPETMFVAARQPDTDLIRTWEMAGTAHADRYLVRFMNDMYQHMFSEVHDLSMILGMINDGPQAAICRAGLRAMQRWIVGGVPAPSAAPILTTDGAIVRDDAGNAVGGVRTPAVDVPVATLTGESSTIPLNGSTDRFDAERLRARYPSRDAYVREFTAATETAVAARFVLAEDAAGLIADATEEWAGD